MPGIEKSVSGTFTGRIIACVIHLFPVLMVLVFVAGALRCAQDDNPFTQYSNAAAVIVRGTFEDGSEGEIFSRETLDVGIAVFHLVESVTINAPNNRLCDTDVVINVSNYKGDAPYIFKYLISWHDTGWHTVTLSTMRKNGDKSDREIRHYCINPLSQRPVQGSFDANIRLSAGGVDDVDVMYHWSFGQGALFESRTPSTTVKIFDAALDGIGMVWVSGVQGDHASPMAFFTHELGDTIGPSIVCANRNVSGDTVRTGETGAFFFRAMIMDRGKNPDSVAINGQPPDAVEGLEYVKVFHNLNLATELQKVTVWARDASPVPNQSERSFVLVYDASVSAAEEGSYFTLLVPPSDSAAVSNPDLVLLGRLTNKTGDEGYAVAIVNNASSDTAHSINAGQDVLWSIPVQLEDGANDVYLAAYNYSDELLCDTSLTVFKNDNVEDETAPRILEVSIGGKHAGGLITPNDTVTLRIFAFDNGNGIDEIIANSISANAGDTAGIWYASVPIAHLNEGNILPVTAIDLAGNKTDTLITVFHNNAPQFRSFRSMDYILVAGMEYEGKLNILDIDNDDIMFQKENPSPEGISVTVDGTVTWAPQNSDTGGHKLSVKYSDRFEDDMFSCSLVVVGDEEYSNAPSFNITEKDFPAFVTAGEDTVSVFLSVTGAPPLSFSAFRRAGSGKIDIPVSVNMFTWIPEYTDTGYQHFVIVVKDRNRLSDTLYPEIYVAGPNRQCRLEADFDIDTLSNGILDMRDVEKSATIYFSVSDPDPAIAENYEVSVSCGGRTDFWDSRDQNPFIITLNPADTHDNIELIIATVKDRGGHTDTLVLPVMYEDSPPEARVVINTSGSGEQVSGGVNDFPLLVRLNVRNFIFELADEKGRDVRFSTSGGAPLPMHIEYWNAGERSALIWVLVNSIQGDNTDQYINMTWGNEISAGNGSNSASVFGSGNGFCGVWHLDTVSTCRDATENGNHGTNNKTTNVNGIIGRAASFAGITNGQNIDLPVSSLEGISGKTSISFWAKKDSSLAEILFAAKGIFSLISVYLPWNTGSSQYPCFIYWDFGWDMNDRISKDTTEAFHKQWHYWTFTHNSSSQNMYIYRDGQQWHSGSGKDETIDPYDIKSIKIGCAIGDDKYWWQGQLDEFRISKVERSDVWIKMSYENQKPGSRMVSIE